MTGFSRTSLSACLTAVALATPVIAAEKMPEDFVYLREVDPSIVQDIRYAGSHNFTGAPIPGYQAPECVLQRQAAEALQRVQTDLRIKGLTLKVYDCYRPKQAVASFVEWAKKPDDPKEKAAHYPNLNKSDLFPGYIATHSGHSRGATVDITIEPLDAGTAPVPTGDGASPQACTASQTGHAPDGSLAMGTSFDCLDVKANTETSGLTEEEQKNRTLLVDAMQAHGFKNYPMEWWHFTLEPEPYPDTFFDFPITPRQN